MNTQIKPNTVWIDADACPVAIKEIVYRAAERTGLDLYLVANQYLQVPKRSNVFMLQVPRGFDEADNEIVKRCAEGDLVVTADTPLAAEVLEKGGEAISPRGERFRRDTIAGKLSMRSFMADLRDSGVQTGGPAPLSQADRHAFATQLEAWLKQQGDG